MYYVSLLSLMEYVSVSLQYWYEGDETGDLPVDFSIVWDGDFFIDKPPSMKGKSSISPTYIDSCHSFFTPVVHFVSD